MSLISQIKQWARNHKDRRGKYRWGNYDNLKLHLDSWEKKHPSVPGVYDPRNTFRPKEAPDAQD